MAAQYLKESVLPRLRAGGPDNVRREVLGAAARLAELVGWMNYDAGNHALAQQYFTQGLRLAREADDRAFGSYLLTSLSHQALYLGHAPQALRLAQAAREGIGRQPVAHLLAEAAMLEARAHADLRGTRSERLCSEALRRAEANYNRIQHEDTPEWATTFDEVIFASYAGTCWVQLGNAAEAERLLQILWDRSADQPRRRIYAAVQLAHTALLTDDIERAAALGATAADLAMTLKSQRSHELVIDLARRLRPHQRHPAVQAFTEQARLLTVGRP